VNTTATPREGDGIDELEKALAALEVDADERRAATFEPTHRISLDPDVFLEQEARREKVLKMQDAVRPGRTTPIALRLDRFTLKRLKAVAALRGTPYQTLLKQFVVERLYEEEKRAGIIDR
jgi:predicted DNA binding CopG/RHH family protein